MTTQVTIFPTVTTTPQAPQLTLGTTLGACGTLSWRPGPWRSWRSPRRAWSRWRCSAPGATAVGRERPKGSGREFGSFWSMGSVWGEARSPKSRGGQEFGGDWGDLESEVKRCACFCQVFPRSPVRPLPGEPDSPQRMTRVYGPKKVLPKVEKGLHLLNLVILWFLLNPFDPLV